MVYRDLELEEATIRAGNDMVESGLRSITGERTATTLARRLWQRLYPAGQSPMGRSTERRS